MAVVTTQMQTQVAQLYVSLFGRAPEAEGMGYWAQQLASGKSIQTVAQDMFNVNVAREYYPSYLTNEQIVAKFYTNVLGRTADATGLAYWTARLNTESSSPIKAKADIAAGTVISEMLTAVVGYNGTDPAALASQSLFNNKVKVGLTYAIEMNGALDPVRQKTAIEAVIPGVDGWKPGAAALNPQHHFTLTETWTDGTPGQAAVEGQRVVYWGYNPSSTNANGTPNQSTGGVPVTELVKFLTTITGLDLKELGLIDADGKDPFQNVTGITLSNPLTSTTTSNGTTGSNSGNSSNTLTISFANGTVMNAEVQLGDKYFTFLQKLLFDANGNSLLHEVVVGGKDAVDGTSGHLQPIKLTPSANNGGTLEDGYTTAGDDTIVAGRLELLHQAYIDGGAGYNILEIDAKGTYAQPAALLNIQEVRVHDIQNFYTLDTPVNPSTTDGGNLNNTRFDQATGFLIPSTAVPSNNQSWIDLSRASEIKKLVVTDQGTASNPSGDLNIVGVRNGATLRLEGGFNASYSGATTIQYGQGQTGTLNIELAVGTVTAPINILQNASVLNIDSQGVENNLATFFAGGQINRMYIKGTGLFGVDGSITGSFNQTNPIIIDASANTGGLDVTLNALTATSNAKVIGTATDDILTVSGQGKVTIAAGNGDNTITSIGSTSSATNIVNISTGTGNDTITAQNIYNATIVAGDGVNAINADGGRTVSITSGNGNDTISAQNVLVAVTVVAGDGANNINTDGSLAVSITSGAGNDTISSINTSNTSTATIDAGAGNNKITVVASEVNVTTGAGNDTVVVAGAGVNPLNGDLTSGAPNTNQNSDNNTGDFVNLASTAGALLNIDLGTGTNSLTLGRTNGSDYRGVIALEGSKITGSNISLFVENHTDLREASLSGITKVTLKQELTVTADQFKAIGADAFSVFRGTFGATEDLHIVVNSNTNLSDLLNSKNLSTNVRLSFELHNGATLTMTAEQLHKNVAVGGLDGADGLNGKIVITGAGANFDPFTSTGAADLVIAGGTIGGGTLVNNAAVDVTIIRDYTGAGYERPTVVPLSDTMIVGSNTATAELVIPGIVTEAQKLEMIGSQNIKFTGVVDLGGDVSNSGNDSLGAESDAFIVDFSKLTGKVSGLTLDHFQDVKSIRGNGAGSRVDAIVNEAVAATKGLDIAGVDTLMVSRIDTNQDGVADGSASITLSALSKDLKFVGLKGGEGTTLTLNGTPWGVTAPHIVLEGDGYANSSEGVYADGNPDTSDVGNIVVNFTTANANAIVDINNAGVELGSTVNGAERKFNVGSITLNQALTATINVAQGDAKIASIGGMNAGGTLKFVATEDVSVTTALQATLAKIDASGVTGAFSATLNDPVDHAVSFVGGAGMSTLTLNSFSISATLGNDYGSSIDGGAGGVKLITTGTSDLSAATLTNVKAVAIAPTGTLTLSMAEATAIGQANITVNKTLASDTATLNINGLDGATAFTTATFGSGVTVNTVTVASGTTALNAAASLKGVASLVIPTGTTLSMTAAQFMQLPNSAAVVTGGRVNITDVTQADVTAGLLTRLSNISSTAGSVTFKESVTLGSSDSFAAFKTLNMGDGLTLTVPSVAQLGGTSAGTTAVTINGGANTTIVFTDSAFNTGALNAVGSDVINASRFNVTTIKLLDTLVAGQNIDSILTGLRSTVTKVVYNAAGATLIDQVVNLDAGITTAAGSIMLNPDSTTAELNSVTINMNGGVNLDGGIDVRTQLKAVSDNAMARLKTLTINSTGTATNVHSGDATNIINGTITGAGTGGVTENNLLNVVINADQALKITGGLVFSSHNDSLATTTFDSNATANVAINGTKNVSLGNLDTSDADVVALVVNNAGTGVVTANVGSGVAAADKLSFTGSNIKLNVTATRDMKADVLSAVTDIAVTAGQGLTLTMAQATALGSSHLSVAGVGTAALTLLGLADQPFAVADYSSKFVISLTLAANPVVTLNAATSLVGINSLTVPDGTTLNLTAKQFLQLGSHIIAGSGGANKGTVNITDLTQADIDALGAFNLSDIVGVNFGSITLKESVALEAGDNLGGFKVINVGDNMTLKMPTVAMADGVTVNGGANSSLVFTQTAPVGWGTHIDATGFKVTTLKISADAIAGYNIDSVFTGLPGSVAKQITSDILNAPTQIDQIVSIDATTSVTDRLIFNPASDTEELRSLTLNLQGGVDVQGDIVLDAHTKPGLKMKLFDTLTINSTGTAGNANSSDPMNKIGGKITAFTAWPGNQDNNLLKVNISADQALSINGIEFSSVNDGSSFTTYDSEAVAVVNVTGSKNVSLGEVNTNDTDVDGLTINNAGTGRVAVTLNSAKVEDADVLKFTGSKVDVKVEGSSTFNFIGDDLSGVSTLMLDGNAVVTMSMAQFNALGVANFKADTSGLTTATVNVVGLDSTLFNVAAMPSGIVIGEVTTASGVITLDPNTNLTGVTKILVPEGSTLNLTAKQYQQLAGSGTIQSIDGSDANLTADKFFLNITGMTQADVNSGFSLANVQANAIVNITLAEDVTMAKITDLTNPTFQSNLGLFGGSNANVSFTLTANQTLGLANHVQASGLTVNGGANSTIIYKFDNSGIAALTQIDASKYTVTTLKALAAFFTSSNNNNSVEFKIDDLKSSVELRLYADASDLGFLAGVNRVVVIEAGVTAPAALIFNDVDTTDELRTLKLTLSGDSKISGDLSIPTTTDKDGSVIQQFFDTLTIVSEGSKANTINGSVNTAAVGVGATNTDQNNLLKVVIDAKQDLVITGDIAFQSAGTDGTNDAATLTLTGTKNVTMTHLSTVDATDDGIATLNIVNNLTAGGTLTVTGNTPAITSDSNLKTINLSGTGNIVFDTKDGASEGITSATLTTLNASALTGNLNLGDITDVSSQSFTFTSGTGVTLLNFGGDTLDTAATKTGLWKFDLSKAAAGSEIHLGANVYGNGADLASTTEANNVVIDLGANATLYIDADTDFTQLDSLSILGNKKVVIADGVTLTLTAAQASGLNIIAGAESTTDLDAVFTGKVNIVGLGDAVYDFGNISSAVAGTITLEDDDVTVAPTTNLGSGFTIVMNDIAGNDLSLAGQTIRFSTAVQAANKIRVGNAYATGPGGDADSDSSTNVVWLFDSVSGPVNTNGYDAEIGRLWFKAALVNGGNVENLFTTLPSTIVRVDFATLADLDVLLSSSGVSRVIELASFTSVPLGLAFNDKDRLEHVQSLDVRMGGSVTVGNIEIDNLVVPVKDASGTVDPTTIHFDSLVLRSVLADDTGDLLGRVGFDETKNVKPTASNKVGDIKVGTSNGLDLKDVSIYTGVALASNDKTTSPLVGKNVLTGNDVEVGSIIFDAEAPAAKVINTNTATLHLDGANNVTAKAVNVTDPDFVAAAIDLSDVADAGFGYAGSDDLSVGFSGTLTVTGASPAINLGAAVETFTIKGDATSHNTTATVTFGSADAKGVVVNAGVAGAELSEIIVNGYNGTLNLGTISSLDGSDDVAEGGDLAKYDGVSEAAFNFTSGAGVTTARLAAVAGQGTPTLNTGSHWFFDYTAAAAGSYLAFGAGLVIQNGSYLTLTNVPLVIESSIDLTQVNLTITSANGIEVKAGQTLTLTPAQADALDMAGIDIFGAGTLKLVGDASNLALGANHHFKTATIDLSGATLIASPAAGFDVDKTLSLTVGDANTGSIGGAAVAAAVNVIGSANADNIVVDGTMGATVAGMGGDDTIDTTTLGAGATHNVTSGVDTIVGLIGEVSTKAGSFHDVLVVSSGATAKATLDNTVSTGPDVYGFIATAGTVNNGTVELTIGAGHTTGKVDMSAATGTKGYTLMSSSDNGAGTDTLIGSAFADLFKDGNTKQSDASAVDTYTGGAGADVFEFQVGTSTPVAISTATTTPGRDREIITVNEAATGSGDLVISYKVNNSAVASTLNVPLVNGDSVNTVAGKIALAFQALTGFSSTSIGAAVSVEGVNGNSLEITGFVATAVDADTMTDIITASNGTDVAQVQTLTIGANAAEVLVQGEKYTFTYTPAGAASSTAITLTALLGETAGDIVLRFETEINLQAEISATHSGNVLTITDSNPDNGGFTASAIGKGGFSGSGASETGALTIATADTITDFLSGTDKIDLNLVAGSATNYVEAAGVAAYGTALTNANAAFAASPSVVQYYLTSVNESAPGAADGYGVLFFDANGDGAVDGVVKLLGITQANFAYTDIQA